MSDQFRTEQPVIPWWKERIAALEAELAEADFNFGGWRSIKSRLQAENATLTAQLAEAKRKLEASERLRNHKYLPWVSAGSPDECEHGIARGIFCRDCDLETLAPPAERKAEDAE